MKNETAYTQCKNRQVEIKRVPQILNTLAVNGYAGALICRKTLETGKPVIAEIGRHQGLGEFNDSSPAGVGQRERFLMTEIHGLVPLFAEELNCGQCPYRKEKPSGQLLEEAEKLAEIVSSIPPDPELASTWSQRVSR